jgi:hypothetical protein
MKVSEFTDADIKTIISGTSKTHELVELSKHDNIDNMFDITVKDQKGETYTGIVQYRELHGYSIVGDTAFKKS